jgi:probable HAF family extracellular repeat protein
VRSLIQSRQPGAGSRAAAVALLALTLVAACSSDDPLPTGPRTTPTAPVAAIVGATVTGVPFDVAAINESGQVVGTSMAGGVPRAMLWSLSEAAQDLGTLGGTSSWAYAINESGQVVGASLTSTGSRHAFLWTPGQGMQDLGTLPGGTSSTARGINDLGQVVGESKVPRPQPDPREPETQAFLWTPGQGMHDLGALGPSLNSSIAFDINNAGHVVGRAFSSDRLILPPTDPEYFSRAFLWAPGQGMQDLGDLGGGYSVAYAINDAGQVVGRSWLSVIVPDYGVLYKAFLWTPGQGMRSLGDLWSGPSTSAAHGINDAGQVVGASDLGIAFANRVGHPLHGFLWSPSDGMEALSPTTGIRVARDINVRHQVVGDGRMATLQLSPGNRAPVAVVGGPYSGTEGSPVAVALSGTDTDDVGFLYTVSFGDGTPNWVDIYPPGNHLFPDNGTYTLALTVRDRRGGTDTKTATVSIANAAPAILAGSLTGPSAPVQVMNGSASAPVALEFRDLGGRNDTYAAEVACGNGIVLTPSNIPVFDTYNGNTYIGGTGTYTGACTYTSAGVYTVRATVSDEDGGTSVPAFYRYVVVFDTDGASTTGSGFYSLPGQGKAKAHFSFNVRFPKGQSAPNGTARFWIPGGALDFESTAIEMLVASGRRAQFWGTGILNGVAARFRVTAVDGGSGQDAIRIELWDAAGTLLLYDTERGAAQDDPVATLIIGGNVQIHGS